MQLIDIQKDINAFMQLFLEQSLPTGMLKDACVYSTLIGGKRLRPALVYAAHLIKNEVVTEDIRRIAAAVELVHCYSLAHDDLPSMDNDLLRRGHPTVHVKFNDATALLAGDVLQTLAFVALSQLKNPTQDSIHIKILAEAAAKMVYGQQLDLLAEKSPCTLAELEEIHVNKTGALIKASLLLGAIKSKNDLNTQQYIVLSKLADDLGLAYQIQDDILDLTATTDKLGKMAGSDLRLEKSTYPSLLGLEGAGLKLKGLNEQIREALEELGSPTALANLVEYILQRQF